MTTTCSVSSSTMFWSLKEAKFSGNSRQRRKQRRYLNRKYPGILGKQSGFNFIK